MISVSDSFTNLILIELQYIENNDGFCQISFLFIEESNCKRIIKLWNMWQFESKLLLNFYKIFVYYILNSICFDPHHNPI